MEVTALLWYFREGSLTTSKSKSLCLRHAFASSPGSQLEPLLFLNHVQSLKLLIRFRQVDNPLNKNDWTDNEERDYEDRTDQTDNAWDIEAQVKLVDTPNGPRKIARSPAVSLLGAPDASPPSEALPNATYTSLACSPSVSKSTVIPRAGERSPFHSAPAKWYLLPSSPEIVPVFSCTEKSKICPFTTNLSVPSLIFGGGQSITRLHVQGYGDRHGGVPGHC